MNILGDIIDRSNS